MPEKKSDPTKDPEFQKVVQVFLTTKPRRHKPIGKRKRKQRQTSKKVERIREN
jgi:hypothetical protein